MLQRSLSSSSLLRRAAAAVRSEHSVGLGRPDLEQSNIAAKALVSRPLSGHHTSLLSSGSPDSQSPGSPGHEKRHIHFNEQVEQCIALGMKETGGAAENKGKTIGILPSTTLKYVDSITKPHETTLIHSSRFWYGSQLCPLPAQESCRPTGPEETESEETDSEKTALADNEEEDDIDWLPPSLIGRKNSMIEIQERSKNTLNANSSSHNDENAGTRATPEVFVQNNEDEDARVFGLLGKAVDALNTAKDIAYLIWKDCWPS
jgi:hypothetical protein